MWNADTEYYTVGSIAKSINKIAESETNAILLTHIYMTAHFPCFGIGTSIKHGGVTPSL